MASDHAVRLRAVLDDLENGRVTIADAAAQVRKLRFPLRPRYTVGQLMSDSLDNEVPPRPEAGSAVELAQAYYAGRITFRQYEVLADAAVAADSDRSPGHGESSAHD